MDRELAEKAIKLLAQIDETEFLLERLSSQGLLVSISNQKDKPSIYNDLNGKDEDDDFYGEPLHERRAEECNKFILRMIGLHKVHLNNLKLKLAEL